MEMSRFQRALRENQTEAESYLWFYLRAKRLQHHKFKRQKTIGSYIVDFVCLKKHLIIEVDGGQDQEVEIRRYDDERTQFLESKGFRVLRFWNHEIFLETEGVLDTILLALNADVTPDSSL
ncbi:MAG: endonuclease domain-containing protein [Gammaproteobacteria bacterium]|nr:endonuclease domain-containing protein [Gammaproteobacteria bacterium]